MGLQSKLPKGYNLVRICTQASSWFVVMPTAGWICVDLKFIFVSNKGLYLVHIRTQSTVSFIHTSYEVSLLKSFVLVETTGLYFLLVRGCNRVK